MSTALLYYIYGIILLQQILLNYAKPTNEKAISKYNHYDNKYPAAGEMPHGPAEQSNWLEKLKPQQAEKRTAKDKNHTVEFDCLLIDNDADQPNDETNKKQKQWYRMSLAAEPAANSSSQTKPEKQKPKDCKNNNISKILNWLDTEDRRELQELVHQLVKTNDHYHEDVLEHTTAHAKCEGCTKCHEPELPHSNNSIDAEYNPEPQPTDRHVLPDTLGVMNTFNHDDNVMTINSSKKLDNKLLKRIVHIVQDIE